MQIHKGMIDKLFLILLLSGGVQFIIAAARINKEQHKLRDNVNYRLPDNVIPNSYFIELTPDLSTFDEQITIRGTSSMEIQVIHPTSIIALNFVGQIMETRLISVFNVSYASRATYDNGKQMVLFHFASMLERGPYILELKYTAFPSKNGILGTSYVINGEREKMHLLVTNLLPTGARKLFPCWDEPHLKARFSISVKTPNLIVHSHMQHGNKPSTRLSRQTSMYTSNLFGISTYSTGMVIAPKKAFTCIVDKSTPVNVWCRRSILQIGAAFTVTGDITHSLAWYTNSSLPLDKMYHVVIPGIQDDSITNWGFAVYEEKNFIYDEDIDPIAEELRIIRLITRAMAHQWLSNMVSPSWWNHLWLNEGFAGFVHAGDLFKIRLDWRMQDLFTVHIQHEALHLDVDNVMMPLEQKDVNSPSEIKSIFSYPLYVKAPVIFAMLENIVTPEVLRGGIIKYLKRHKYKHAMSDDLWAAIEAVQDETYAKRTDYTLKDVMHTWITEKSYPVVNVERDYHTGEIKIWQEAFHLRKDDNFQTKWYIPITHTTENELNFYDFTPPIWLKPNMSDIKLLNIDNKGKWIIMNLRQCGYYRVNYDDKNWRYIVSYLNSKLYRNIHVRNRAQIIDDAFHFTITSRLDHNIFLDLMDYLSKELDYVVWYPMLKIFEYLSGYLPYQESNFLKEHMVKILTALLENIGYTNTSYEADITKCLRMEVAKWACTLGNLHCTRMANYYLDRHLEYPDVYKIVPGQKDWTYCKGLMKANLNTWNTTWSHLMHTNETQKRIFEFLSCAENPTIIKIFLQSVMKRETLRYKERIDIFYTIISKHAKNKLDIILDTYNDIFKDHTMSDKIKVFSIIIDHVHSIDEFHKIEEFVQRNRYLNGIIDQIEDMLRVRWRRVHHHLNKFLKWFNIVPARSSKYTHIKKTVSQGQINITEDDSEYRLSSYVKPKHYYINLTMPMYDEKINFTIDGACSIVIKISQDRQSIMLHSPDLTSSMNIHEVSLIDAYIRESDLDTNPMQNTYDCEPVYNPRTQILTLNFKTVLSPGYYNLKIKFNNTVPDHEEALFRTLYIDQNGTETSLVATHFQLIGARQIFPCWDEPAMRVTFNISIKHHSNYMILSNVPGWTKYPPNEDKVLSNFNIASHVSINSLIMVMIPKFDYVYHVNKSRKNYVCRPQLVEHMQRVSIFAEAVQEQLQKMIPRNKIPMITHVAIPKFRDRIIGHMGLVIYNEETIMYDEQTDPIGRQMEISRLIACAMAQAWFHDVCSPSWWNDLWLIDGAAKFFGAYAIKKIIPEWRTDELFAVQLQHESLHFDIDYDTRPISGKTNSPVEIKSLQSFHFSVKAPVIVRMFQHATIDPNTFFKSFSTLSNYELQRLTIVSLLRTIQNLAFETFLEGPNVVQKIIFEYIKLSEKLYNWTTQTHYPVLKVTRDYRNGTAAISQENVNVLDSNLWWIPITHTTQTKLNFLDTLPNYWLEPQKNEKPLNGKYEKDEWIIANLQQTGYYRVKYDKRNWKLIANYLNSEEYEKIHAVNRAQLIDDAYHFMMAKQLDREIFYNLTNYLSRDTDYVAWYPMIKIFEYLSGFLPFRASVPLKRHMLNILNGVLEKIGYEETSQDNDLTKCLRQEAAKWACIFDDPHCEKAANNKLRNYLKNPENYKLLPGWKQWTYCNGLKTASDITFIEMWHLHARTSNYTILEFMPCHNGYLIPKFLWSAESSKTFLLLEHRKQMNILYYIVSRISRDKFDDILKNFEEFIFYYTMDLKKKRKILSIIVNNIYAVNKLYKMEKYLRDNEWNKQLIADIQHIINTRLYYIKQHRTKFLHLKQRKKTFGKNNMEKRL